MEFVIHKYDQVFTADEQLLGRAIVLYRPLEQSETEPWKETYLFVVDYRHGAYFYVPINLIDPERSDTNSIYLITEQDEVNTMGFERPPLLIYSEDVELRALAQAAAALVPNQISDVR
ncbi:MAG: hypothetical protein KDE51_18275 [Anaerolineales bacterium]|nr:hypothetical protein [Anaerolineales bacterium]